MPTRAGRRCWRQRNSRRNDRDRPRRTAGPRKRFEEKTGHDKEPAYVDVFFSRCNETGKHDGYVELDEGNAGDAGRPAHGPSDGGLRRGNRARRGRRRADARPDDGLDAGRAGDVAQNGPAVGRGTLRNCRRLAGGRRLRNAGRAHRTGSARRRAGTGGREGRAPRKASAPQAKARRGRDRIRPQGGGGQRSGCRGRGPGRAGAGTGGGAAAKRPVAGRVPASAGNGEAGGAGRFEADIGYRPEAGTGAERHRHLDVRPDRRLDAAGSRLARRLSPVQGADRTRRLAGAGEIARGRRTIGNCRAMPGFVQPGRGASCPGVRESEAWLRSRSTEKRSRFRITTRCCRRARTPAPRCRVSASTRGCRSPATAACASWR